MSKLVKTKLLEENKTDQIIKRIAFQIFENNFEEEEIILAGIKDQGYIFAEKLAKNLNEISNLNIILAKLSFDKDAIIQPDILIESEVNTFKNKVVILIDDVLNTGRTLAYCFHPFLSIPLKKLQVAVLVDRNHPKFPILADYVGYSLSTTISEHVEVVLTNEKEKGVFLY